MIRSEPRDRFARMDDVGRDAAAARLRWARSRKYRTAAEAARAIGVNPVTLRAHESGQNGMTAEQARFYSLAFGQSASFIMYGGTRPTSADVEGLRRPDPPPRPTRRIPIIGEVAAGVWRETTPKTSRDAEGFVELDVEGYERARLYALRVVGTSMNLIYPEGRILICAPAAEAGVRDGDHVIVERSRAGLIETTVKELVVDGNRLVLRPRSDDPAHQAVIILLGDDVDQDAPRITGVVVADYAKRQRPDTPPAIPLR